MLDCIVIAEIGINHNGNVDMAIEMMESAHRAGADYVKFQKRDIDLCYTEEELAKPCDSPWGSTLRDKVAGRELSWFDYEKIDKAALDIGIEWTASCFDLKSLSELQERFGESLPFHKVPSCMAIHPRFLRQVASYGKLALVSTGLCPGMDAIVDIADIFEESTCGYILNVTTSLYPCPIDRCNLQRMVKLYDLFDAKGRSFFQGVGYSGHEGGNLASVTAAAMGAVAIERHFTTDRSLYGADQAASITPSELAELCGAINTMNMVIGEDAIGLSGDEKNPVPRLKEWP